MKLTIARLLYGLKGLFDNPVELFRALGVDSDDWILEVGCAVGYHTLPLATIAADGKVCAVDIWEEALAYLEQRALSFGNLQVVCCSADALPFPRASFDKILCFDTLHELPEPTEAVTEWSAFLRRDGKLFFRDPVIPPEKIQALSKGRLHHVETARGVDIFIRAAPREEDSSRRR